MLQQILYSVLPVVYNDSPEPWQLGMQDSASPMAEGIQELNSFISYYLVLILFGVVWMLGSTMIAYNSSRTNHVHKYATHGTILETVWTISPALVLIAIAFPSFKLLYLSDEVISPSMTIKAVGNQWFWAYEYSDFVTEGGEPIEFESYIVPESDLTDGQLRQLDVDNRVIIPVDTHVRIIVTSNDVLHDFAVPSLGLKIDCTPGRLNQTSVLAEREGVFYGQCSELCGVMHGFIPITIEAVSADKYLQWIDMMASDE